MDENKITRMLKTKKAKVFGAAILIGAIFAPNGFFTGHRTVVLEVEVTTIKPIVYAAGDKVLQTANIMGKVTSSRHMPIAGAMITAFNEEETRRITVYSDFEGNYSLPVSYVGNLTLRLRTPFYKDNIQEITIADGDVQKVDFVTEKMTDPEEISDSLTASAHMAVAQWKNDEDRATLISQCNFCHQIGNEFTRVPRTKDEWTEVVNRMEGYLVFITNSEKEALITNLHETFDGKPVKAIQTWDVSPKLSKALIEEWTTGDGLSFIHDADVGQDGRLYGTDEGHDLIWELNRETGEILKVAFPEVDLPVGGKFAGIALPIGVFTGRHGPHSMAETTDGRMWITNSLSSRLMAYTPEEGKFETYDIAADSMYPHTIRADKKDRLWFTVAASNQVGVFDPKTEQLDLLDLPANGFGRWLSDAMLPTISWIGTFFPRSNLPIHVSHHKFADSGRDVLNFPYGIDINPLDQSAWYVKIYSNRIGRIDPVTLEVEEFDTPAVGPRRPRFAPNGILWIPGFDTGVLMSFNPETRKFKQYTLPKLSPSEYETPYAVNVHPKTGVVWLTSNMSDRIFSFDPKTESFVSYPLPTRSSYLRDLVFTEDGKICSSHSNLPSYSIEGGLAGFICLDPNKNN